MQRILAGFLTILILTALPAHAENAIDYFNLGLSSNLAGAKIKYFSKALEIDPYLAEAYEKRGMLYYFQEKFDKVIQDFQAYIRVAPPKAEAYRMLGIGYLKSGFYERAADILSRAIEMDPGLISAYVNRAEAYRLSGKYADTIRDATVGIRRVCDERTKSDAYRIRARALREMDRNDLAIADVNAAWDIDPRIPLWWRYFLKSATPEEMSHAAPFLIIGIVVVLILGIKLKPPEKDE
jgi:tetratricopeptide (TPR) repeat protein